MPRLTVNSEDWTALSALGADTTFQCIEGSVEITAESSPSGSTGFILTQFQGHQFASGATVSYRRRGAQPAVLHYE